MAHQFTLTTGARLHFGPLSYRPQSGRHFGGVGVMIDEPSLKLTLKRSDLDSVAPGGTTADRVQRFVACYRERCPADFQPPPCRVQIEHDLPSHNGLGSGTQIGLAVARGLSELCGEQNVPVAELARRVGRGRRSAIGIHGFAAGGLIVDAGQSSAEEIGSLACRLSMPSDWRTLLITPRGGGTGLSGEGEEQAFETLGSMAPELTDRLCRIVLSELLPAIHQKDFDGFSRAVSDYGRNVGGFFAPVQGGIFGHPQTDALIDSLSQHGIVGTGQTSWGPTVFAFVPDTSTGQQVAVDLSSEADVRMVAFRNAGATLHATKV